MNPVQRPAKYLHLFIYFWKYSEAVYAARRGVLVDLYPVCLDSLALEFPGFWRGFRAEGSIWSTFGRGIEVRNPGC